MAKIEPAKPGDHKTLSKLARASKKHWGYPEEWLDQWKEDLVVDEEFIQNNIMYVIMEDNEIAGFCTLMIQDEIIEIEHMWIHPDHMGKGFGKELVASSTQKHISKETKRLEVISDPNAVGFYEKIGFRTIDFVDSMPEGRKLPHMILELESNDPNSHT